VLKGSKEMSSLWENDVKTFLQNKQRTRRNFFNKGWVIDFPSIQI